MFEAVLRDSHRGIVPATVFSATEVTTLWCQI